MKIALIFTQNERGGIGDRCFPILSRDFDVDVECFSFEQLKSIPRDFDLYLRLDDVDYGREFPLDLHSYVWWVPDTHIKHSFKKIKANGRDCDYLLCFQKEGVEKLKALGFSNVDWLPAACDQASESFDLVEYEQRKRDVCFVGTTGKFSLRKVMLEKAKINFSNHYMGPAHFNDLQDYYGQSRIAINYSINNDINMRIFEAMGAGALVVTNQIKDNGFLELFEDQKNIITYDDITVCKFEEKVRYYLEHPKEAWIIAKNGFDLVQKKHTYHHRLKEIISMMRDQKES